jgi:SHS2 domain-containing protein
MTFENFEHKADIGVRGLGKSIENAFEEAARAMFSVEVDLKRVRARKKIKIKCSASNNEELFVEFLNALLAQASIHQMVFSKFKAGKIIDGKQLKLSGFAWGEKLDVKRHKAHDEVKAATYSQLKVKKKKIKGRNLWVAQCIVDV